MNLLSFLGAGFSVEAHLPTQRQFLSKVNESSKISTQQYSGVTAAYILAREYDYENAYMEEAFSILDYMYYMKDDNFKLAYIKDEAGKAVWHSSSDGIRIIDARRNFIETLEIVFNYNRPNKTYINQDLYDGFFDKLLTSYEIAIITTNYDLVCESVLNRREGGKALLFPVIVNDYRSGGTYIPAPLMKLHGSVNWKETKFDPPNIIPPTWAKHFERGGKYRHIWNQAENAIAVSDIILFIGYNMAEVDKHIKYLFHMGLSRHSKKISNKKVYVVNKKLTTENKNNYKFINDSKKVTQLKFIEKDFRQFVESDFLSILNEE